MAFNEIPLDNNNRMTAYINPGFDSPTEVINIHERSNDIVSESNSTVVKSEHAVQLRNAFKSYGTSKKKIPILYNLNMTVEKGTIYSLLGSSGCGKTTLLTCVVGVKNLDSGQIRIFGAKPGTRHSGVPGAKIGYMPQDIALYNDFSIKETITYFGNLYGMQEYEIESSRNFLAELLSLPEETRRVSTLSGGQKRRVSLAVSLVHAPPLIILDEPTVGVDPLLRETIWNHLRKLVRESRATVIITTHYIDEAGYSDTVGVMRGGRLLTEKSPHDLYEEFKINSLQDVVLQLCHNDEKSEEKIGRARSKSSGNILHASAIRRLSTGHNKTYQVSEIGTLNDNSNDGAESCLKLSDFQDSLTRIKSLTMKNFFVMMRNILLVVFVILMPALQMVIMAMSMGKDPRPIKLGVVNHDINFTESCVPIQIGQDYDVGCDVANLSCRFLDSLPTDIIELFNYQTKEEAREDVKAAKIRGFMSFPQGYSEYMYERSTVGVLVENETLIGSSVSFELDASNTVITQSIQRIIYDSYKGFVGKMLSDCGFNPEYGGVPIKFENAIYGRYDMNLDEYVASGMLVGVALFFPLLSSTITFLWDKKQGTMERARVAGTKTWEIMLSFFITEGFVLFFQTGICFLTVTLVFNVQIIGSLFLAFALVALNGFAGVSLGLLLASICTEEIQVVLLSLAIMMPNFYLAGTMWPVEAMPWVLQKLSYALPGNLATEAFRSIVVRGWGFLHVSVWSGFASTLAWISFYWIIALYVHKVTLGRK